MVIIDCWAGGVQFMIMLFGFAGLGVLFALGKKKL
jgi:hypothetical protein